MIYPKFPQNNEVIGICAPSSGVGHKLESFDLSLEAIKSKGYKIIETDAVRVNNIRPASGKVRADEFHSLLENPDVKMIIAASGGEYCFEMLPYLDANIIRHNPKWFCGYSDPTNIEFYLTTKLDIATIYGFNAGSFDWRPLHKFQETALSFIEGNIIEQSSYDKWDSKKDYENVCLDTDVSWDLYLPGKAEPSPSEKFDVSGRIIGGCTDIIANLIGTPYDGSKDFIERYKDDGCIWYFDTFDMNSEQLYFKLLQFRYAGMFDTAKAIIIGRVMYPGDSSNADFINAIQMAIPDTPFIWGADIGHTKPSMTLINGSIGHLSCKDGKAKIKFELK